MLDLRTQRRLHLHRDALRCEPPGRAAAQARAHAPAEAALLERDVVDVIHIAEVCRRATKTLARADILRTGTRACALRRTHRCGLAAATRRVGRTREARRAREPRDNKQLARVRAEASSLRVERQRQARRRPVHCFALSARLSQKLFPPRSCWASEKEVCVTTHLRR